MYKKGISVKKAVVGSTPIWLIILAKYLNAKFNLGFDEQQIEVLLGSLSALYFFVVNWLKNRNK